MYLHAYQSYVWNMVTTRRIQLNPHKPIIGDLVREKINSGKSKNPVIGKVITLDENNLNDYSIEEVFLPLPGHIVIYPNNECKILKNLWTFINF